jgi:hypothetical protein
LIRKFGSGEDEWWRQGIPMKIRKECASRREEDDEPSGPYTYTTLIDLSTVITRNWSLFESDLPQEYRVNRKLFESDMVRLNRIRNRVMHPVKEKKWSEDEFVFVRRLYSLFGTLAADQADAARIG